MRHSILSILRKGNAQLSAYSLKVCKMKNVNSVKVKMQNVNWFFPIFTQRRCDLFKVSPLPLLQNNYKRAVNSLILWISDLDKSNKTQHICMYIHYMNFKKTSQKRIFSSSSSSSFSKQIEILNIRPFLFHNTTEQFVLIIFFLAIATTHKIILKKEIKMRAYYLINFSLRHIYQYLLKLKPYDMHYFPCLIKSIVRCLDFPLPVHT